MTPPVRSACGLSFHQFVILWTFHLTRLESLAHFFMRTRKSRPVYKRRPVLKGSMSDMAVKEAYNPSIYGC